jgi:hypothetical protein
MSYKYRPRGMPGRFMEGAPSLVRQNVVDIIAIKPAAPMDYDVVLRDVNDGLGWQHAEMAGLDFDKHGHRGCHWFLAPHEMRTYRERNRRKRVAWRDLPAATQRAIEAYLGEDD